MSSGTTPMEATATAEVDEKLYSRQLYVMGHEAQRRMMASRAVLIGLSGLGVEVAKNCILAGISGMTLCDPFPPNSYDLGGNFYLSETDLGSNESSRAALVKDQLATLNPYVDVTTTDGITVDSLMNFDNNDDAMTSLFSGGVTCVVVTIPLPIKTIIALNKKCRDVNASFIYSITTGVFGQVFCDFGDNFVCSDLDGNPPATSQMDTIIIEDKVVVVKVLEDQGRHGLETGDIVIFSRLQNAEGLIREKTEYKVKTTGPYTFELIDLAVDSSSASSGTTTAQGYITQVKKPVTLHFESYEDSFPKTPEMMSDFSKFDRPALLHVAFQALAQYREQHGNEYPAPGDIDAAKQVLELAKNIPTEAELDWTDAKKERIVLQLASGSRAILSPMCAALGGMVGQEVLKACSGKFTPLPGFFYLDADETLPEQLLPVNEVTSSSPSRYDSQIAVFGKTVQQKILELRYFLIGAGAIGCEMLKNWALMGVGCGGDGDNKGHIYVTDMDRIEKSNLSRQFLFRNTDINHFKSTCAARSAQEMNPSLNITAYQDKAASDTEHIFGDDFYDRLSGVCTALDNVEARLYVDQRCVFYRLPMLESGTLGTKGNTQVVVPNLTENYGATRDPPEKSIPVCTLKNFPNQIQHTLQWARDYFEGEFKQTADEVNAYLTNEAYLGSLQPNTKLETLKIVHRALVQERPESMEDCVVWARLKFQDMFHDQIRQLLHNFPPDQVTSTGTKFWSGSKRCPNSLVFDAATECEDAQLKNHYDFVVAAANLRAQIFGIKGNTDPNYFQKVLKNVLVPDFSPAEGVKIAANDEEAKSQQEKQQVMGDTEEDEVQELLNSLPKPSSLAGFKLSPVEFDKDLDDHMVFVTACSNLRALNYQIPTADVHRSRAIAGRIIPAIATTTALVTGLICLELYKIIGSARTDVPKLDSFKNAFVNLAIPFMTLSEPVPPGSTKSILKGKEWNWTAWDSLDIPLVNPTMGELMAYFETEYGLEISMLSHGVAILYSFFANAKKIARRKTMKMTDVITDISSKTKFAENQLFLTLDVIATDPKDNDEEVELPYLKLRIR